MTGNDKTGLRMFVFDGMRLECLGCAYYCSNKYDEALRCLVDSLRIYEDNETGPTSKKTTVAHAKVQEWIGKTLFQLEEYDRALLIFNRALSVLEENIDKNDESFGNMILYMGRIQVKMQNYNAAVESFKESLSIHKKDEDNQSLSPVFNHYLNSGQSDLSVAAVFKLIS